MGSTWLGLVGAIIGGFASLIGTLLTSQLQWRRERARWSEQRERDLLQWKQQRETDAKKWENERRRDALASERDRADEQSRWLREEKLKCYLAVLDHLLAASELSSNVKPVEDSEHRPYAREDERAIVHELRKGHRWMRSVSAVCGEAVTAKVDKLINELYFTIAVVTYEGIKPGQMVRQPEGRHLREWILSETIDHMSTRLSAILRTDLGSH